MALLFTKMILKLYLKLSYFGNKNRLYNVHLDVSKMDVNHFIMGKEKKKKLIILMKKIKL